MGAEFLGACWAGGGALRVHGVLPSDCWAIACLRGTSVRPEAPAFGTGRWGVLWAYGVFVVGFPIHAAPAGAGWATLVAGELLGVGAAFLGACWTRRGALRVHGVLPSDWWVSAWLRGTPCEHRVTPSNPKRLRLAPGGGVFSGCMGSLLSDFLATRLRRGRVGRHCLLGSSTEWARSFSEPAGRAAVRSGCMGCFRRIRVPRGGERLAPRNAEQTGCDAAHGEAPALGIGRWGVASGPKAARSVGWVAARLGPRLWRFLWAHRVLSRDPASGAGLAAAHAQPSLAGCRGVTGDAESCVDLRPSDRTTHFRTPRQS